MAQLPDFEALGERPAPVQPRRTPNIALYRPTSGMEEVPAQVMAHSGAEMQQAAHMALASQEYQDSLRAEDAFTKLRQTQIDLAYGKTGFMGLKGGDAVNKPILKTYGDQFDQQAGEISSGLDNDYQRQLFQRRAQIAGMQLRRDLVRHVVGQQQQYASDVLKGTVETESQHAAVNPASVPLAALRIDRAIEEYGGHFGKPREWVEGQQTINKSALYAKVVEQTLDTDPGQALQLYKAYADGMTPNDRVIVGHRVNQAILPAQAKAAADYIIGGHGGKELGTLNRLLDVGGETALQRVSQDLETEAQATPTKTRETKGTLGTWLSEGERIADSIRPNDPVFKDMLTSQIKNHVSTIVAMQQGVQTQAQGVLLTALNGGQDGKGPKPLSLDQLLRAPGAQAAYDKLDPQAALGIRAHIEHNAREAERGHPLRSDTAVVDDLFRRIGLPDDDPRKISRWEQLTPYFAHGLNRTDFNWLYDLTQKNRDPDGQRLSDVRTRTLTALEPQITKPGMGIQDPKAKEQFNNFVQYATGLEAQFRRDGKDPLQLYNYQSPDYIGNKIGAFQRSLDQIIKDRVNAVRAPQTQPAPTLPDVARSRLREGSNTTFGNGQTWTLRDGKPVQVQP